ncbi:MAG TPA: biopolymer transporter ExbD [Bacteroidia bacterium]|nr:biopolymer transporter ExbD [Bacteroidia bacterium]
MSDVAEDGGGGGVGHGKHARKGRKKHGNPRVDMTPMVDLAFLLLTFFVLTSNLNKAKMMELTVPKEKTDDIESSKIDSALANTVIIDGNKEGVFYIYPGMFKPEAMQLYERTLDPKTGLRAYILAKNSKVSEEMKQLRKIYKTGHLTQADFNALSVVLRQKAIWNEYADTTANNRKIAAVDTAMIRLNIDLKKGQMSDTTYRLVSSSIRNDDRAPFFIVKWGADAKYSDVINVIDELKIGDVTKYALTKISYAEYQMLSEKTGRKYEELKNPPPPAATAAPAPK